STDGTSTAVITGNPNRNRTTKPTMTRRACSTGRVLGEAGQCCLVAAAPDAPGLDQEFDRADAEPEDGRQVEQPERNPQRRRRAADRYLERGPDRDDDRAKSRAGND